MKKSKAKFTRQEWHFTCAKENLYDATEEQLMWYKLFMAEVRKSLW